MEGRLPRTLLIPLVMLAWLAVAIVLGWLLAHVARTLLMVVLATVVAFAATPAVNLLARFLPRIAALAVTYVLAFLLLVVLLGVIVVTAAAQTSALVHALPGYAADAKQLEPQLVGLLAPFGVTAEQLNSLEAELVARLEELAGRVASDLLDIARRLVTGVADAVLVVMLSIYFVANAPRVRGWLQEQIPPSQRRRARMATGIFNQVVGGYVRGTLTMALLVGVLVGVGMGILQVRYALLLGILAFFMAFVPILGTFISGTVCVLVALLQGWLLALIVLAYFIGVHVLEGDVIGPRVLGGALGIHPAVALVALLAGTELFGFWGALFGAPLAGLLQAIVTAAWRELHALEQPPPAAPRRAPRKTG